MKSVIACFLFTFFNIPLIYSSGTPAEPAMKLNWFQKLDSYRSTGNAIAIDDEGFIYVTGNFEEWVKFTGEKVDSRGKRFRDPDFFVAKYDQQGNMIWIDHGGGAGEDAGIAIAVVNDNVYVTGYFTDEVIIGGVRRYTSDVQNLFIANYNKNGGINWIKQPLGDGVLRSQALATDSEGNVYITGNFREHVTFDSFTVKKQMEKNVFLVKIDQYGEVKWLKEAAGGNNFYTFLYAYGIATDVEDNVIIAGEMSGPVKFGGQHYTTSVTQYAEGRIARRELFLAKYNKKGELLWMKEAGIEARFVDITTDMAGNIVMTGYFQGAVNREMEGKAVFGKHSLSATPLTDGKYAETLFIVSYDSKGKLNWVKKGECQSNSRGTAVTGGKDGNIYFTGYYGDKMIIDGKEIEGESANKANIFIAVIDPSGNITTVKNLSSSKGSISKAIAADESGNIFITGFYLGRIKVNDKWITSAGYENFFLTKFENYLLSMEK